MDREKLLRIKAKCKKFFNYMKFMALIILAFLYLQNLFFQSDISSKLLFPKIKAVAGSFQIVLFTIFIFIEEGSLASIFQHVFMDIRTTFKMALPPIFLILSSNLLFISAEYLPNQSASAANYKIIGVAIFTVLLMKKRFFLTQALSVYFIANGLDHFRSDDYSVNQEISRNFELDDSTAQLYGNALIVLAILCYGLSFVILEKILKSNEDVSLWIRGIQLNLFAVPLSLVINFTNGWMSDDPRGFFDNFNIVAWFFIVFQVAQGMMEIFVIKVADSVYRCIALSAAIVVMGILRNPFTDYDISPAKIGTGLVLAGIVLYSVMDYFPVWGELYSEEEPEEEYRVAPVTCNETLSKGYQNVPTVSSCVSNADVYLKLIDGIDETPREN